MAYFSRKLWVDEKRLIPLKEELYAKFEVETINLFQINAKIYGESVNLDRHHIHTEIKAVTYHMLDIYQDTNGWEARVIFDI